MAVSKSKIPRANDPFRLYIGMYAFSFLFVDGKIEVQVFKVRAS